MNDKKLNFDSIDELKKHFNPSDYYSKPERVASDLANKAGNSLRKILDKYKNEDEKMGHPFAEIVEQSSTPLRTSSSL